jgi:N-methylhydantoinase A
MLIDEVPKDRAAIDALADQYGNEYEREFGYQLDRDLATIEIVNARVAAIGVSPPTELKRGMNANGDASPRETRSVYFEESSTWMDTPIYERSALGPASRLDGPAIIEQGDTTVLVPPGTSLEVDQYLNIVIDVGTGGRDAVGAAPAAAATVAQGV